MSDPLADAVAAADQMPLCELRADWDRDGYLNPLADLSGVVSEVTVESSITGDLPDEVGLVEGYASSQLTATLDGEYGDGTEVFAALGPYRTDSPLYVTPLLTVPVTCDMGLATDTGPELRRQFTGQLRSLRSDSGSRSVAMAAMDAADRLRARITLPALAINAADALSSGHTFLIRPQAVIDYVLRRNGIYASPPAHPSAQISCTGHGWLAAEAGRNAVPRGVAPLVAEGVWWVPGPFGMLAVRGIWDGNGAYQEFFSREPYVPAAGNGIGIAAWMRVGNDMGVSAGTRVIFQLMPLTDHSAWKFELYITSSGSLGGVIDIGGVDSGFAQPISTSTQWMYVGLHFQHNANGTTTIRYRQNGVTTSGNVTTPALTSTVAPFLQCTAWTLGRDWSNFQVWYDPNPPAGAWPGEVHTPQASIDEGLNLLTHLPDVVNADSWEVIKAVAGAEYGLAGFDVEIGEFAFRSRDTYDPSTVEEEITADRSLIDLATQITVDNVRNVVTTETTPAFFRYPKVIAESRDVQEFQSPVGVWEYDVPLPYGAIGFTTITLPRQPTASWNDTVLWGYVSVQAAAPTVEITSGITVTFTMKADRLGLLTVRNYSAWPVRFATTGGSPALRVVGWALVNEPARLDEVRSTGSVAVYDERVLPIPASPWRQLTDPLRPVAGGLLSTLAQPRPVLDEITVTGNPVRRCGHTVRLTDPDGHGSLRASVVKIRRSQTKNGAMLDTLALRPVAPPGLGISDDLELGLADSTLIAAP